MDLKSNIVDPYIGQTAEGKKIEFESTDSIEKEELKVFKFNSTKQYIKIYTKEFIAVCPFSGLPDVAKIKIEYYPEGKVALELKSLKYYLISFKNVALSLYTGIITEISVFFINLYLIFFCQKKFESE